MKRNMTEKEGTKMKMNKKKRITMMKRHMRLEAEVKEDIMMMKTVKIENMEMKMILTEATMKDTLQILN